jgi:uncharacterized protein YhbP (UPF0306 family)
MVEDLTQERIRGLIEEYLNAAKLMQVATCINDQPWLAHVWFAPDDKLNLYFISRRDRRHSEEIRTQHKVAGGIVQPPFEGLGQKVRGLTFQGTAEQVGLVHLREAYGVYKRKWPQVTEHAGIDGIISNAIATRFYKIAPSLYVLFDEVNFPEQPRQEYRL